MLLNSHTKDVQAEKERETYDRPAQKIAAIICR